MVLLPLLTFTLLWLAFRRRGSGGRQAFLWAAIAWGLIVAASTEAFSLFQALAPGPLALLWALVVLALLYSLRGADWRGLIALRKAIAQVGSLALGERMMLGAVALIVVATGLTAILAPPNTWDAMTYHLARVVHWLQNGSVAHYPAHIIRQLYLAPWSEYAILQLQALSGGDLLANLVQWFAMLGSLIGLSLIARELGANRRQQLAAALIGASLPMGILQASSTQNDYVAAFWLICLIFFSLRMMRDYSTVDLLAAGAALGLAVLSKGSAYFYALPLVLGLLASWLRRDPRRALQMAALLALLPLLLNLGQFSRNLALFQDPVGPQDFTNDSFAPAALVSNLARNAALHLGTTEQANAWIEQGVLALHDLIGLDVSDALTTWPGTAFQVPYLSRHEDTAGNLLHFLLIAASLLLLARAEKPRQMSLYLLCLLGAVLLFSWLLKWQPWHSRLHLAGFLLFVPLVALALDRLEGRWVPGLILALVTLGALPWLLLNRSRPQVGPAYLAAADELATLDCDAVGLVMGSDDWEYPLWALSEDSLGIHWEHVAVENESARLAESEQFAGFEPCALVLIGPRQAQYNLEGRDFRLDWYQAPIGIYQAD